MAALESTPTRPRTETGFPLPLGVLRRDGGANFAVFSRNATHLRLEMYDAAADAAPARSIELDESHRTGDVWHVWVEGIEPGQIYAYRADGPYAPGAGHRFNVHRLLLDPCAAAITAIPAWDFTAACGYDAGAASEDLSFSAVDDSGSSPKCVVVDERFDWRGDRAPRRPWSRTVIYEAQVRGFTIHPSSGAKHPGTFRGMIEKIPCLLALGATAVELMPVQEFNSNPVSRSDPAARRRRSNYWGYDPVVFCAPKASYSSDPGCGRQAREFKEMVRAYHLAGLEIILDVVFNHTAEGDQLGPTLCFRGLDNSIFYSLKSDKRYYRDFTGAGNTVNANHPVVREHILSALRYWAVEMHVDGFRFDLAPVLGRGENGKLLADAPLLARIAEDPILRDVKLIAEAWDAAGAYEVGRFSDRRWAEWNGRYRDDVRRFWRGDAGMLGAFASRLCGSSDVYAQSGKGPECSVNFVACHDGFTLRDLVSYRDKRNAANGEENRDGTDANFSDGCGVEGETTDARILAARATRMKNFLLTLFASRGVPMLLAGDERGRTQAGNNNAWCQDNETSWLDWRATESGDALARFTREMIALRRAHPVLSREEFYGVDDIRWFSPEGALPIWSDPSRKAVSCLIPEGEGAALFLMFNAGQAAADFSLPPAPSGACWLRAVDTSRPSPDDIAAVGAEPAWEDPRVYRAAPGSAAVLTSRSAA